MQDFHTKGGATTGVSGTTLYFIFEFQKCMFGVGMTVKSNNNDWYTAMLLVEASL
jgi:hypothetical protein